MRGRRALHGLMGPPWGMGRERGTTWWARGRGTLCSATDRSVGTAQRRATATAGPFGWVGTTSHSRSSVDVYFVLTTEAQRRMLDFPSSVSRSRRNDLKPARPTTNFGLTWH